MSTFKSRIDDLARLLEGHQADEEEALAAGRLRAFASTLDGQAQRLTALVEAAEESRRAGSPAERPEVIEEFLRALDSAEEAAREDVLDVGRGDQPPLAALAAAMVRDLTTSIDAAWVQLREADPPPDIDPELLDLAIQDDPGLGQRHAAADARIYLLREKPRPGRGDIDTWSQAVSVLREIEVAAAKQATVASVIEFLRGAASPAGAPLSALDDPDVRAWLSQEGRADRYRIHARGRRQS